MRMPKPFSGLLGRFLAAQAGVAAVEFAIILPMMLLVYVGTMEGSSLITVDRKVQTVSGTVGDLVARIDTETTDANLLELIRVASGIMTPYDSDRIVQVVTQVKVNAAGDEAIVVWSKGYKGNGVDSSIARAVGSIYTNMPAAITNIAKGQHVIVAEARYSYRPLSGIVFEQNIDLYRENFYLPRFGGKITIK